MTAPLPQTGDAANVLDYEAVQNRMTFGEHLEELRRRLIYGLLGFVITAFICMCFGKHVVYFFCRPLMRAMAYNNLSPQIFFHGVEENFVVYIKTSLITAAAIAGPWMIYQLWKFVAAGLYPQERKYVTKYIPLSVTLLISGMVFLYLFVLPVTLNFFLAFNIGLPLDFPTQPGIVQPTTEPAVIVPSLAGDPSSPVAGQIWYNQMERRLKFFINGDTVVVPFSAKSLTSPLITIQDYIDMVINLMLSFGLAFQLPLVVMALARTGIVEIATLKKWRRYVYFGMSVIAACIIPDVVTGMVALLLPLIALYEFGILLATWGAKRRQAAESLEQI